jgi:membrane protease YdiL (CAAX protease family)
MPSTAESRSEGFHALGMWVLVYVGASFASLVVLAVSGQESGQDIPMWVLAMNVVAMWSVYLYFLPRFLPFTDTPIRQDFLSWFSVRDVLWGIPLGVGSQLILMNLVNWPLAQLFPEQFSPERISERAEDIASMAPGWWAVLLVLVVVVGAPVVEEIVYRGSLQTRLMQGFGISVGIFLTALLFALIHLAPVEIPGLFVFALVLGIARHKTGTLGLPIVTHLAFNATGLSLVLLV